MAAPTPLPVYVVGNERDSESVRASLASVAATAKPMEVVVSYVRPKNTESQAPVVTDAVLPALGTGTRRRVVTVTSTSTLGKRGEHVAAAEETDAVPARKTLTVKVTATSKKGEEPVATSTDVLPSLSSESVSVSTEVVDEIVTVDASPSTSPSSNSVSTEVVDEIVTVDASPSTDEESATLSALPTFFSAHHTTPTNAGVTSTPTSTTTPRPTRTTAVTVHRVPVVGDGTTYITTYTDATRLTRTTAVTIHRVPVVSNGTTYTTTYTDEEPRTTIIVLTTSTSPVMATQTFTATSTVSRGPPTPVSVHLLLDLARDGCFECQELHNDKGEIPPETWTWPEGWADDRNGDMGEILTGCPPGRKKRGLESLEDEVDLDRLNFIDVDPAAFARLESLLLPRGELEGRGESEDVDAVAPVKQAETETPQNLAHTAEDATRLVEDFAPIVEGLTRTVEDVIHSIEVSSSPISVTRIVEDVTPFVVEDLTHLVEHLDVPRLVEDLSRTAKDVPHNVEDSHPPIKARKFVPPNADDIQREMMLDPPPFPVLPSDLATAPGKIVAPVKVRQLIPPDNNDIPLEILTGPGPVIPSNTTTADGTDGATVEVANGNNNDKEVPLPLLAGPGPYLPLPSESSGLSTVLRRTHHAAHPMTSAVLPSLVPPAPVMPDGPLSTVGPPPPVLSRGSLLPRRPDEGYPDYPIIWPPLPPTPEKRALVSEVDDTETVGGEQVVAMEAAAEEVNPEDGTTTESAANETAAVPSHEEASTNTDTDTDTLPLLPLDEASFLTRFNAKMAADPLSSLGYHDVSNAELKKLADAAKLPKPSLYGPENNPNEPFPGAFEKWKKQGWKGGNREDEGKGGDKFRRAAADATVDAEGPEEEFDPTIYGPENNPNEPFPGAFEKWKKEGWKGGSAKFRLPEAVAHGPQVAAALTQQETSIPSNTIVNQDTQSPSSPLLPRSPSLSSVCNCAHNLDSHTWRDTLSPVDRATEICMAGGGCKLTHAYEEMCVMVDKEAEDPCACLAGSIGKAQSYQQGVWWLYSAMHCGGSMVMISDR